MRPSILLVDDEVRLAEVTAAALQTRDFGTLLASSAEEALGLLRSERVDLIISDLRMPGLGGRELLEAVKRDRPELPVIIMTAYASVRSAVDLVKEGAFDYIAKPFEIDDLIVTVERALKLTSVIVENQRLRDEIGQKYSFDNLIGRSAAFQRVLQQITEVCASRATVLILGESGTGKELVARAIHFNSPRAARPFVAVNCAAIPEGLLESELFGHVKGAFTGAGQSRPGLLSLAEGGTIFLDELADVPLSVQAKLLRVLEHGEVLPVGGNQAQTLNIRILAATHQNLERKVSEGTFRHDLFFRLNVFQIHLPALRDRREDIVPLTEHFLRRLEPGALPLQPATAAFLTNQPWLGNVRELRNALEHAVILARGGPLLPEHFPATPGFAAHNTQQQLAAALLQWLEERLRAADKQPEDLYEQLLQAVEPPILEEVMRRLQGNRWAAAQWLGLNRATVRKKLHQYGLADVHRQGDKGDDDEEGTTA